MATIWESGCAYPACPVCDEPVYDGGEICALCEQDGRHDDDLYSVAVAAAVSGEGYVDAG